MSKQFCNEIVLLFVSIYVVNILVKPFFLRIILLAPQLYKTELQVSASKSSQFLCCINITLQRQPFADALQ